MSNKLPYPEIEATEFFGHMSLALRNLCCAECGNKLSPEPNVCQQYTIWSGAVLCINCCNRLKANQN